MENLLSSTGGNSTKQWHTDSIRAEPSVWTINVKNTVKDEEKTSTPSPISAFGITVANSTKLIAIYMNIFWLF